VTIQFEGANSGFTVLNETALKMIGTKDKPIILEGTNPKKGTWAGVVYEGGKNIENVWEYVTVRHTGGEAAVFSDSYYESTLSLSNCTFSENTGYGMKLQATTLKVFSSNIFKNNDKGAAFIYANLLGMLDEKSDFKGNGKEYVEVGSEEITQDMTIHKINVLYRINEQVKTTSKVSINAGVTFEFFNDASFYTRENDKSGVIVANGTQSAPIQFLSYLPNNKGVWRGINIQNVHPETKFNYCIVEGSGSGSFFCDDALVGICLGRKVGCTPVASRGIVTNCTFRNCEGYGLAYRESDNPTLSGNTFTNCSKGDVLKFK
jgi:parallel beta-helix repeat protein